ncbi:hypothetical protein ACFC58_38370 [Kitasatospora purpeofusca]|uniref:hypothetical protein n=1 Tax=Kitasatospora purpeofusca TaxID=67352 RepID=UPI0035D83D38
MTIPETFLVPGGDHDDDAALGAVGRLTGEQNTSLAQGLTDMEPVPAPSALRELASAAAGHPSVCLDAGTLADLFAGVTHPDELLDQLVHPQVVADQLGRSRPGRRRDTKRKVSPLGRMARLSTDSGYAAVVTSPLHQVAGIKVLPVNPRFLSEVRHAFTERHASDPAFEGANPGLLEVRLPAPHDLRDLIAQTVELHLVDYDWSESIALTGVQNPLTCMPMRVHYSDGTNELIVVAVDGQSRLVSTWRNVVGIGGRKLNRTEARQHALTIVGRMFAHDALAASRKAVNAALKTATTTSWTASEVAVLHARLAPVTLVVGTFSRAGEPADVTQWFDEHLTQIHLRTRGWGGGSDREKAVADALTAAVRAGDLTKQYADALSGRLHGAEFSHVTGLPHHPAFARAALFETALSSTAGPGIRAAIAGFLSLDATGEAFPRKLLEILAIFSTRFLRSDSRLLFPQMVHTWSDGGAITRPMWNRVGTTEGAFALTRLPADQLDEDPAKAAERHVERLREHAEHDPSARDELAVLGGDALIVAETLTRDRGSKEDLVSGSPVDKKTPYRSKPPGIVAALTETPAGRLLLGQALANWVQQVPGDPEDYSRGFTVPRIATAPDGTVKIATTRGLPDRASEWDVFALAEPGLPARRRKEIAGRRDAARQSADRADTSTPTRASIDALQTAFGRTNRVVEDILAATLPAAFPTAGVGVQGGAAAPRGVAAVVVRDALGQQAGGVLVQAGGLGDIDQGGGQGAVLDSGAQQFECLRDVAVPGQEAREELQRLPSGRRVRAGQLDRLRRPVPALQQLRPGPGGRPPSGGDVRSQHRQRVVPQAALAKKPGPHLCAEPLAPAGLQRRLVFVATLEDLRDQLGWDTAGQGPGLTIKISSVHGTAP